MYFTLVFKNDSNEGPTVSYDVCFHPCAIWYNNGEEVLVPNSEVPSYKKGYLSALISKESESGFIKKDFSSFNQIIVKLSKNTTLGRTNNWNYTNINRSKWLRK